MTRFQAWKTAARVHTLPAAIVPVLVGTGLAYGEGVFRWDVFVCALIGAVAIQVAANFANDASDAHRGADTEDRLGPPRMVALGVDLFERRLRSLPKRASTASNWHACCARRRSGWC